MKVYAGSQIAFAQETNLFFFFIRSLFLQSVSSLWPSPLLLFLLSSLYFQDRPSMLRRSTTCRIISPRSSPALRLKRLLATQHTAPPPFRNSRTAAVLSLPDANSYRALKQFSRAILKPALIRSSSPLHKGTKSHLIQTCSTLGPRASIKLIGFFSHATRRS